MRLALFLFLTSIWPISLKAEVVSVTSGEHESYTRLVFAVSPTKEWRLESEQNSAKLVFLRTNMSFNDERVFSRIPKTRLTLTGSGQQENSTEYLMHLGCDCEVTAFPYLNAYIVVDISDRSEAAPTRQMVLNLPALAPVEANHIPPSFVSWTLPLAPKYYASSHETNFLKSGSEIEFSGLAQAQTPDDLPTTMPKTKSTADIEGQAHGSDVSFQEAVNTARASLLHQLTLAADQGLLDLNEPNSEPSQLEIAESDIAEAEQLDESHELEDENQILIQTVYSRDAKPTVYSENSQVRNCPSRLSLDIASWGNGLDFSEEISGARRRLLMEFDEPDLVELERLIRTYIRYGFGAEAISYLSNNSLTVKNRLLLLDLAATVDEQPVQSDGPLSKATNCAGLGGMWALVGVHPIIDVKPENAESIIEAFAELPPDLRRLFGPRLASVFVDSGYDVLGRKVADILERAPGDHGDAHDLVIGSLMEAEGREAEAGEEYQILIEDSSKIGTDALIALASLELDKSRSHSTNLTLDLGMAANVERGTERGGELRRLEALWLAKSGDNAEAIKLLIHEMLIDPSNSELYQQTAEEIISGMSSSTDVENSYAEIVHYYAKYLTEKPNSDRLRQEIAQNLLQSGLPHYALKILQPSLKRDVVGARLLAAQANLVAFRPNLALISLKGLTSDEAGIVRTEAFLGIKDFESALSELNKIDPNLTKSIPPHWFNGDWEVAAKSNNAAAIINKRYIFDNIQLVRTTEINASLSGGQAPTFLAMRDILEGSEDFNQEIENILVEK